jgi:prostaglandin-E synthase
MTGSTLPAPSVLWAQRQNCIFLTIQLEDCQNPDIKVEPNRIYFRGTGGTEKKEYELDLELYEPIVPDNSLFKVRDRNIEFCLKKEKEGPYWPRLPKSNVKYHWLKVDFNKWKDEEDSDDEGGPFGGGGDTDFEEMMKQMGGLGGGGLGEGDKPSMDDLGGGGESDSDDDNDLPDLE